MPAMKPLRILMLTTVRFHNSKGGTEKVMIDTANAMAERGHHVVILYKDKNGDTPGFPLNESVKTFNCYHEKIPFSVSGLMRMLRSFSFSREKHKQKLAFLKLKKLACTFKSKLIENSILSLFGRLNLSKSIRNYYPMLTLIYVIIYPINGYFFFVLLVLDCLQAFLLDLLHHYMAD